MNKKSIKWTGNNFHEIYEWLINDIDSNTFIIKVDEPGHKFSSIEIKINNLSLRLKVNDLIIKLDENEYYVIDHELI
jgi:hypothetical protein